MRSNGYGKLTAAAVAALLAGAPMTGCSSGEKKDDKGSSSTAATGDKHVCKGANACKGQGADGKNECKGKGACASADWKHECKTKNGCKGQGGCKTDTNACAGKNECKSKGGCAVPKKA
jgi:hypothetical protein